MNPNEPRSIRLKREDNDIDDIPNDNSIDTDDDDEDDEITKNLEGEAKCKAKFFNCVGNVAKGSLHYLNEPGGITG